VLLPSGTIDSPDEFSQLTYNVVAKLSSHGEARLNVSADAMGQIVADYCENNQPLEVDQATYTAWFAQQFYGAPVPGVAADGW